MALERKVLFERVELDKNDNVSILLKKAVVEGDALVASTLHRVLLTPSADVEAELAKVSAQFTREGFPAIPDAVIDRPRQIRALVGKLPPVDKPNGGPKR